MDKSALQKELTELESKKVQAQEKIDAGRKELHDIATREGEINSELAKPEEDTEL